ncbi:beta-N-acetylhexosaminidase [Gottfriedia solisilvae]|uniref:beta-N-acetylhexosaminidase n=1 Tax=Gottfriedia solisilvae TaxID=1516104 RepID=UPI003D2F3C7C
MMIGIILICGISVFYVKGDAKEEHPLKQSQPSFQTEQEVEDESESLDEQELLALIVSNAQQGKISEASIFVGKTDINEVIGRFGTISEKDEVEKGTYLTFKDRAIAVGYDQDGFVFEARSYKPNLHEIHYDSIIELLQNPTTIKYYKDQEVDQIILGYKLAHNYELKFILPRPTDEIPNPSVHHISVSIMNNTNEVIPSDFLSINIDEQIKNMSLNEKIGQMIFSGIYGTKYTEELKNLVQQNKIGGFIFYSDNIKSKQQSVNLINSLKKANESNPLPILFGVDQEGGRISRLPVNIGKIPSSAEIGKRNNPELSFAIGQILGKQVKTFGFNLDFAPVLDINSNPHNPVIGDRSFGNSASIVSELGIQTMKGIQSDNIIPVIKHFPGHGDTGVDSHLTLPIVYKSYEDLKEFELVPFKNAIKQNADVVMIAHILLPKIDSSNPSSMSKKVVTNILRNDMQFNGVVMTDDMTMDAIGKHFNLANASVKSIQAGSDIIMVAHDTNKVKAVFKAIQSAVNNGSISEERINQSVKRIILLKQKYKIDNKTVPNYSTDELIDKTNRVLKKYHLEP